MAAVLGGQQALALTVQRHSSWEHTMLGNSDPRTLGKAVVSPETRHHVVQEELRQANFFEYDAGRDPRRAFPQVRWIQLRASRLWISYGELTSLADNLPSNVDELPRSVVEPVVQRMRSGTVGNLLEIGFKLGDPGIGGRVPFAGEATAGIYENVESVAADKATDRATAGLGAQRYFGLLSRNACHFAPFSWYRWARFNEEARDHALAYYHEQREPRPIDDKGESASEAYHQAVVTNGYGEHFLQDSFAAGHLVNKTLVMQWFVDYVNGLSSHWWDLLGRMWWGDDTKPWYGMPSDAVMDTMGSKQQPGIAGRSLYGTPPTSAGTVGMDRDLGDYATDPQTGSERRTYEGRRAGSGVQATAGRSVDQNYGAYRDFLNSSFISLAGLNVHDWFNKQGLVVGNARGDVLHVGGDNTMLNLSGPLGAQVASEASVLNRRSIEDIARTGQTSVTVDQIMELVPTSIWLDQDRQVSLEKWHDEVLHQWCIEKVFPDVVDSFHSKAARAGQAELVKGGISDAPPPPVPPDMGDFVVPRPGGSRAG